MKDRLVRRLVQLGFVAASVAALFIFARSWWIAVKAWGVLAGLAFGWLPSAVAAILAVGFSVYVLSALAILARMVARRRAKAGPFVGKRYGRF